MSCPHFRFSTSKGFGDCHPSSYSWPLTTGRLSNTDEENTPSQRKAEGLYNRGEEGGEGRGEGTGEREGRILTLIVIMTK